MTGLRIGVNSEADFLMDFKWSGVCSGILRLSPFLSPSPHRHSPYFLPARVEHAVYYVINSWQLIY